MKTTLKDDIFKVVEKQINECCELLDKYQNDTGLNSLEEIIYKLKYIISPRINDLSLVEINAVEMCLIQIKNGLTRQKYADFVRYATWLICKLDFQVKARVQDDERRVNKKKHHPIRPRRGDIFLAELGQNVGKEINDQHLVIIMQNNKANIFSNTTVVIPISSSGKLYVSHEKIEMKDIKSGRLDKLPSKAKTEQIQFLDKARLIHKVAELSDDVMLRIAERLKKNLDIH